MTQPLMSCQSCPQPEVQVGDRVRVVIGAAENPNATTCDALGLGVGAEFTGELTSTRNSAGIDAPPWSPGCFTPLFTGPVNVASDWTFVLRDGGGASIWGGAFDVQLGEECTGTVSLNVSAADEGHLMVSFTSAVGPSCPEQCSSRHAVTVEILRGGDGSPGGAGGGSASGGNPGSGGSSSGGAEPSASGGVSGSGTGGGSASGGASTGGGSGGAPGLDPALEQRIQAFCTADCASFEEVNECRSTPAESEEACWFNCYSAAQDPFHKLCPDQFLAVLECAEQHPGAQDYSCEGTEFVAADSSCEPAVLVMRECVAERQ